MVRPAESGEGLTIENGQLFNGKGERLYTLAEAKNIVMKEQCENDGQHDIEQHWTRYANGQGRVYIRCMRCNTKFVEG